MISDASRLDPVELAIVIPSQPSMASTPFHREGWTCLELRGFSDTDVCIN